jgi:hypothetical protein
MDRRAGRGLPASAARRTWRISNSYAAIRANNGHAATARPGPRYTAHGVGYLSPSLFAFSRRSDRERLAGLPGAMMTGSAVTFSHAESEASLKSISRGLATCRTGQPRMSTAFTRTGRMVT